ncbi:MAG: LPS export ABC transporter periplasmic protein LptC [Gemmatimonadetes bacterium]|nr:LPS export ABC transporter periplasmic protein LptC [Gemmatimonadota bacterium]
MKDSEQAPRRQGAKERRAGAGFRLGAWGVALLALAVVLGACRGRGQDIVAQVEQAADSADQLMIGLTQYLTAEGVRQAKLEADSAFIYENSGRVDLKTITVTFFTVNGVQTSVLTARGGVYNLRTGQMEARGNCVVVMTNGARLTSEVLRYDQTKNEVSTDQPYTYDSGERHVTGQGFVSDPGFSNIVTQRPRGAMGSFRLPGQ